MVGIAIPMWLIAAVVVGALVIVGLIVVLLKRA